MFSMRNISELKKLPGNPRIIKDKQFKTLVKSIEKNGEYFKARPLILSDRTGDLIIIAGNQRYEAAKALDMKLVPTYLLSGLAIEQEKEITIRDNIANGDWDWDVLANEWDVSELEEWGLDITGVGAEKDQEEKDGLELEKYYKLEIDCNDESTQEKIYNEMTERGFKCHLLTL